MTIQTEQIGLRLKLELVNKLRSYCAEEGRSQTWVIDKALNEYLGISSEAKSLVSCSLGGRDQVKSQSMQKAKDDNGLANELIAALNTCAGTNYRFTSTNQKLINARLKDYSYAEIHSVIRKKCNEWKGTEMARYLRPSTLFNASKFEEYLNQDLSNKPKQLIQHSSTRTRDQVISNQLTNTDWAD